MGSEPSGTLHAGALCQEKARCLRQAKLEAKKTALFSGSLHWQPAAVWGRWSGSVAYRSLSCCRFAMGSKEALAYVLVVIVHHIILVQAFA